MKQLTEADPLDPPQIRDGATRDNPESAEPDVAKSDPESTSRRKSLSRWALVLVLAVAAMGALRWWVYAQRYESTDDAQIEGHLDLVSTRIPGTVSYINPQVENNRVIEAGTLLVELDPRDYQAERERAKASLVTRDAEARSARVTIPIVNASAYGQLRSAQAAREQAIASVESEQATLIAEQHRLQQDEAIMARTDRDRLRYLALVEKHEISRSEFDARDTDAKSAAQAVEADRAALASRQHRIAQARSLVLQRQAEFEAARIAPEQVTDATDRSHSAAGRQQEARADLNTAELNLSYTRVYAPVSGVIGRKTVELGHRVQPGQSLLVIVPLDDIWVTANFKETQLKHMRPGQPVTIHVDTFDRDFRGKVENLPGAAGPLFSLFAPENATGNYVKVVQRFPVRLRLDRDQDPQHMLRPGMSVEPTVTVR